MLRWFVNQKRQRESAVSATAAGDTSLAELAFLREQEDFDEEEMSSATYSRLAVGSTAPEADFQLESKDPGATQPAIRFSDTYLSSNRPISAPMPIARDDAYGQLTLAVIVQGRNSLVSVHDSALIGRGDPEAGIYPDVDLSVDDAVSRRHAQIYRRGGQYFIQDLDSTNGTCLNGDWVVVDRDEPLRTGDVILLGEWTELQVLAVSFGTELTREDEQIGELLIQALGVPVDDTSQRWQPGNDRLRSEPSVDLLDVALSRGVEAGLLEGDTQWDMLAARPEWRLGEFDGLELPSLAEPYR